MVKITIRTTGRKPMRNRIFEALPVNFKPQSCQYLKWPNLDDSEKDSGSRRLSGIGKI